MPSGYSKKSLMEKLDYKLGQKINIINAPGWFEDYLRSEGLILTADSPGWLHYFFNTEDEIANFLQIIEKANEGFWVSWPKKSSGVETNLSEQTFRDYILPLGWVDTKVCSIDETWSGLKFLRRKK